MMKYHVINERSTCSILTDLHETELRYVVATINIILALVATAGNTLVLLAVIKSENIRKQCPTYFIISLAFADWLVGTVVQPMYAVMLIDWSTNTCVFEPYKLYVGFFTCSVSICSATVVCMDRMLKICYPFRYEVVVTNKRALLCVLSFWILGAGIGYGSVFFTEKKLIGFGTVFWLFAATVVGIVCSVKIYKVGCRQIEAISKHVVGASERKRTILQERKLAASLSMILAAILICWLPFVILNVCIPFLYTSQNWKVFFLIRLWTITLGYANSSMNVFIFSFKNKLIKEAIKKLLGLRKRGIDSGSSLTLGAITSSPNVSPATIPRIRNRTDKI